MVMKLNSFQWTARKCATEFLLKASVFIQDAADRGDTKSVYEVIRKAIGLTKKLTLLLLSKAEEIFFSEWIVG